jgi:hypothetical protein
LKCLAAFERSRDAEEHERRRRWADWRGEAGREAAEAQGESATEETGLAEPAGRDPAPNRQEQTAPKTSGPRENGGPGRFDPATFGPPERTFENVQKSPGPPETGRDVRRTVSPRPLDEIPDYSRWLQRGPRAEAAPGDCAPAPAPDAATSREGETARIPSEPGGTGGKNPHAERILWAAAQQAPAGESHMKPDISPAHSRESGQKNLGPRSHPELAEGRGDERG